MDRIFTNSKTSQGYWRENLWQQQSCTLRTVLRTKYSTVGPVRTVLSRGDLSSEMSVDWLFCCLYIPIQHNAKAHKHTVVLPRLAFQQHVVSWQNCSGRTVVRTSTTNGIAHRRCRSNGDGDTGMDHRNTIAGTFLRCVSRLGGSPNHTLVASMVSAREYVCFEC